MPRPRKHRRIGFNPSFNEFGPTGGSHHDEIIILKLEEAESLRLMDLENLDQQGCADQMGIGRTTLQRIYKDARMKVADSLINGKRLIIEDQMEAGRGNGGGNGGGQRRRHGQW